MVRRQRAHRPRLGAIVGADAGGRMRADHKLLAERYPLEVERVCAFLRRVVKKHSDIYDLHIDHEHDWSCCKTENWIDTMMRLMERAALGSEHALDKFFPEMGAGRPDQP